MKTALEQLIEKWESEIGSYIPNGPIYRAFIEEAKTFLDKEKEQIIDAYWGGLEGTMNDWSEAKTVGNYTTGIVSGGGSERYYKDKYNK